MDVILETGSKSLVSGLSSIVVVLYELACSDSVGHDMSPDFLKVSCRSHRFRLVFDVYKFEDVNACHLEIVILFDEVEDPCEGGQMAYDFEVVILRDVFGHQQKENFTLSSSFI